MLRVYHSNHLDVLEALMEFIVERDHLSDPFEPSRQLYLGYVCPCLTGHPKRERI